jgi:hypothetical protein
LPDRAGLAPAGAQAPRAARWVAAATAAVIAAATAVVVVAPTADAAGGPCPDANGVTVVVDFGSLGGGVQVACAPGDPDSGYAALRAAGFSVDWASQSSGFLCRINGRPVPAADPCVMPSPPWAYWSYWIADRGGTWCYSDAGMLGRNPVRGTVEGWSFVSGSGAAAVHAPASSTFSRLAGAGSTGRDCDTATTATTTPPPTTARPATPRPSATRPAPSNEAAPGTQGGSPGPTPGNPGAGAPPAASAPQQPPSAPGAPAGPDVVGATTIAPGSGDTTTVTVAPDTSSTTGVPGDEDDSPGPADADRGSSGDEEALSTVALAESGRSGPGSALGTGLGLGAITALGAAAVVVNRRRLRSPDGV